MYGVHATVIRPSHLSYCVVAWMVVCGGSVALVFGLAGVPDQQVSNAATVKDSAAPEALLASQV